MFFAKGLHGLQLDNYDAFNQKVGAILTDHLTFIPNLDRFLLLNMQTLFHQFNP